jgi:uncharacterized membrane protein YkvA (DUF1232 family)
MRNISEEQKKKAEDLRDKLAEDFDETEAQEFASTHSNKKWYDDFILLLDMVRDPEFELTTKSKLLITGTLAYVVLPIDVIPDLIPVVGWLDDIFLISLTMKSLYDDIEAFKAYKANV